MRFVMMACIAATATVPSAYPVHDARAAAAVRGVMTRLPSWVAEEFGEIIVRGGERMVEGKAKIYGHEGRVNIEAKTSVDALFAVGSYLREFCGSMIAWDGSNLPASGSCRRSPSFVREYASERVRFFGNPETYSISFAWWTWEQWEPFIDWLALTGFNTVLTPIGQEAIWRELWMEMGLSEEGVAKFLTGPAFSAWNRQGSLQHLGGAPSKEYLQSQLELNKKIVARFVELGIVPVLPTFSGVVPEEFAATHKDPKYTQAPCISLPDKAFTCLQSIEPQEKLFEEITAAFIAKQKKIYGDESSHVYHGSVSNFGTDKSIPNMAQAASSIFSACELADAKCIRVVQATDFEGWSDNAVQTFLNSTPTGRLLILDTEADTAPLFKKYNGYSGHNFVWCLQHNRGGTLQLHGNIGKQAIDYELAKDEYPNMVGGGLTMEGISQNYVVYQFFIEKMWNALIDPFEWISSYATARYGADLPQAQRAWQILLVTFYAQPDSFMDAMKTTHAITREDRLRPVFLYERPNLYINHRLFYFPSSHVQELHHLFTELNETLGSNPLFREDLSDVSREFTQHQLTKTMLRIREGVMLDQEPAVRSACDTMQQQFAQLDMHARSSLSDWINMARAAATSEEEADKFERQAKHQLTLFSPHGKVDYARKEWSGLIRKYYAKRWSLFCDHLLQFPGVRFSQRKFEERLLREVETPFGRA